MPPQSARPVQRRLTPSDVDDICATYITGQTITELADTKLPQVDLLDAAPARVEASVTPETLEMTSRLIEK